MGKRRIRNLLFHKVPKENIYGFNLSMDKCLEVQKQFGIKTFNNFQKAVSQAKPDVFVISTPPNQHSQYFLYAAKHKKHFFVEHPTTDKGYRELEKLMDGSFVGVPSCTLRFNPAMKEIKKQVAKGAIGKVLSFQYHLGQYLPDWHSWEDYRKVYFSKKSTGACREMFAFELVWLTHALNLQSINKIGGVTKKLSDLDMTADDYYAYTAQFGNVMGAVVIDLLSRTALRTLRVIGTEGVLDWEWQKYEIRVFNTKGKKWQVIPLKKGRSEKHYVTTEDMYEEETGLFLNAIRGKKKYPFTFKENRQHLKALLALEKSYVSGKFINVT